jgi:hypothetical protein
VARVVVSDVASTALPVEAEVGVGAEEGESPGLSPQDSLGAPVPKGGCIAFAHVVLVSAQANSAGGVGSRACGAKNPLLLWAASERGARAITAGATTIGPLRRRGTRHVFGGLFAASVTLIAQ